MRTLVAGLLGGVVLFAWGAVSHVATPLGMTGIAGVPAAHEKAVADALQGALTEHKIYMLPGGDFANMSAEESAAVEARYATGPTALIVNNPGPGTALGPRPLLIELLTNVLQGLIAAYIVARLAAGSGFGRRVLVVTLIAVSGSLAIDASFWNWYRYPTDFFAAQFLEHAIGGLLTGLVIAKVLSGPKA
jgi:hypothetical protein